MREKKKIIPADNSPVFFNVQAEASVLGSLLLNPDCFDEVAYLCKEHFYHLPHQTLFEEFQQLYATNKRIDAILLIDRLKIKNKLDLIGGETYLWDLLNNTPTANNVLVYAQLVKEKWVLRKLREASQTILQKLNTSEEMTVDEQLDFAETQIFNLRTEPQLAKRFEQSGRELLAEIIDQWEKHETQNQLTGFSNLDKLTQGFKASQLIILAARPSMGKTTLALNMATHIAKKKPVLFFSLETPSHELLMKVISAQKKLPLEQFQKGQFNDAEWSQFVSISHHDSVIDNLFFDEPARLSLQDIRSKLRRFIRQNGSIGLLVVDYLQLMSQGYSVNQRVAEVSEISRGLKAIAREFKIPVLALSQLNRELERRAERRPMMADLRESGSIEQDADLILFIYRDEVYNPDKPSHGDTEIIVAKNRQGKTGKVTLYFEGQYSRFREMLL